MKRLILLGEIGSGKSTLIRTALGAGAARAGGFVTRRVTENGRVLGFDLAPAASLSDPVLPSQRFLDLSGNPRRDDGVFAGLGTALLKQALGAPFAVVDEFGGLELLVPEFYEALTALLTSHVPTIGVLKTPASVRALAEKIPLGEEYVQLAESLRSLLEADPETRLLPFSGWDDPCAAETVRNWAETYVRR